MKIIGSQEGCDNFVKRLSSYDEPNHFWRIFEADVYDREDVGDSEIALYIGGYCAWSLESCCRASGYSNGADLFAKNTKELHIKMEAWSREPGVQFEEHYVYDNGKCILDECKNIEVYYWDKLEFPEYKDFLLDYPDAPPESAFYDENEIIVGGYGEEFGVWHI
jgi:hypothetical protein